MTVDAGGRPRLEAVLPLKAADLERSAILRRSLERFFPELGLCWVVTREEDLHEVRRSFADARYRVLAETELVPELGSGLHAPGWQVQQLVKLAIADLIDGDFYLTLDADVICVRSVRVADLLVDGRAVANFSELDEHPEWYEWAERVLGLARSGWAHEVTPTVLSRAGVLALQAHLAARSGTGNWRRYLLESLPWTEYSLYYTFLEATGRFDLYHVRTNSPRLYGNCVWWTSDLEAWAPEPSFGPGGPLFSVLQSNTGVTADQVWERVEAFLV